MRLYIQSAGILSPQGFFGHGAMPESLVGSASSRTVAQEPDYSAFIEPKALRRMSRIIRMGVAAAQDCLRQGEVRTPDAIITGTAYGCLEDTETFLKKMIEQSEEMLSPTAFIQSTHNTVGAQIALLLRCHGYNHTVVHRGFSFEHSLLEARLLLDAQDDCQILVGGIDELTQTSYQILGRFGLWKGQTPSFHEGLAGRGTLAGEGACFFLVGSESRPAAVCLQGLRTLYRPKTGEVLHAAVQNLLSEAGWEAGDLDLILSGASGDDRWDLPLAHYLSLHSLETPILSFKPLCGEYPTAGAFGLGLGFRILQSENLPSYLSFENGKPKKRVRRILCINHYLGIHYGIWLLSLC